MVGAFPFPGLAAGARVQACLRHALILGGTAGLAPPCAPGKMTPGVIFRRGRPDNTARWVSAPTAHGLAFPVLSLARRVRRPAAQEPLWYYPRRLLSTNPPIPTASSDSVAGSGGGIRPSSLPRCWRSWVRIFCLPSRQSLL